MRVVSFLEETLKHSYREMGHLTTFPFLNIGVTLSRKTSTNLKMPL